MKKYLKNSKKLMTAFGAVAFMLMTGWQFGVSGTEAPFSEKEVALEKAIAGSGSCNPASSWKIKWESCNGTPQIRCRTTGDPCCYANWQEPC